MAVSLSTIAGSAANCVVDGAVAGGLDPRASCTRWLKVTTTLYNRSGWGSNGTDSSN